jgi:hypothetical protein
MMSKFHVERGRRKLGIDPPLSFKKEKKPLRRIKSGKSKDTSLKNWYKDKMKNEKPVCWETGNKINKNDKLGWHGSIAHILPKSLFPSVATHPKNYMVLDMWGGVHAQYDRNWKSASKMKIWKYATGVIKELYPILTAEEKRRLMKIPELKDIVQ